MSPILMLIDLLISTKTPSFETSPLQLSAFAAADRDDSVLSVAELIQEKGLKGQDPPPGASGFSSDWDGSDNSTTSRFNPRRADDIFSEFFGFSSTFGGAMRDMGGGPRVVCLAHGAVSTASSVDYNVLHLIWTTEKLEQQLRLIDQHYQKSRDSALGCLKDGNKRVALRYAAEMKMDSQSIERCTAPLDRVKNVLQVITDAESSKKSIRTIKRFWIVTYASEDEAEKAITEMNGKPLNERVIFVD
ncbi:hypothetical protein PHJA_002696700 [Phtheirospermum japonicum]|uniref:RRM domain-containing protein n=1 Tax=Phtheirospermum japonicum TaxID=374723 RepID=A0A830DF98_9LAMI|nr:hypothetical protein PHJA_002696700 [Phtheirospermum japonicum]